jgi:ABC-type sulfate transport system permease component
MLLYVAVAFVLYCFLFALPDLIRVAQTTPPGPEQEELAKQVAYTAVRPKLLIAFLAAVATVAAGTYTGRLPGMRTR